MLTGIGGGMARDILLAEIPTVLRADLYAVAALACAAIVVSSEMFSSPRSPSSTMRIFSSAEYCFRVARRMSRTSFSGVPAVETDFCLIFAPWRLR
jgi:uncharacterized membrane protein YeiH